MAADNLKQLSRIGKQTTPSIIDELALHCHSKGCTGSLVAASDHQSNWVDIFCR
jgi:hypothetical protein